MITALTSISASPGVSTTAVAWAYTNERRTVIVEADTTGGSPILAGVWRGRHAHDASVLSLAAEAPEDYAQAILRIALPLPETEERWLLPAISSPVQAASVQPYWVDIATALAQLSENGYDVVVDLGRYGQPRAATALLDVADTVLVMTDTTLPAVSVLRQHLPVLRERLASHGRARRLGVTPVIGDDEKAVALRPFSQADLSKSLSQLTQTPTVGGIPRSTRHAAVYHYSAPRPRRHEHSGYVRAVSALIAASRTHAEQADELLQTGQENHR